MGTSPRFDTLNWNLLRDFLIIFRHATFADAALTMGIGRSAISEKIAELERSVYFRVADRGPGQRKITLTPQGRQLHDAVSKLAESIETLSFDADGRAALTGGVATAVLVKQAIGTLQLVLDALEEK